MGPQPFAGGDLALLGNTAGWDHPDSIGSSEPVKYHGVLLEANDAESSREAFSPQVRNRDASERCSAAASFPQPHPAFPSAAARRARAGALGIPQLLVAPLTPR